MANDFLNALGDTIAKQLNLSSEKEVSGLVDALFGKVLTKLSGTKSSFITKPADPTKDPVVKELKAQNKTLDSIRKAIEVSGSSAASNKSVLEQTDKPVRLDPESIKAIAGSFPSFLKEGFKNLIKTNTELTEALKGLKGATKSGMGWGMAGVLAVVFGVIALFDGLADSGPYKGLKKLLGRLSVTAGIAMITKGLGKIVSAVTRVFNLLPKRVQAMGRLLRRTFTRFVRRLTGAPMRLLKNFGEKLLGIFGKSGGEGLLKTGIGRLTEFVPKFLGRLLKGLKLIPLVGALISIGFAVSRFKNGDVVGGGIEILSGIASMFPGWGTGISIALDVLNAVLDSKTGGSSPEASKKKWDLLKQWGTAIAKKLYDTFKDAPVIGHIMKAGKAFKDGEYIEGLKELAMVNPATGMFELVDWIFGTNIQKDTASKIQTNFVDPFNALSEKLGKKWDEWKKGVFEWFGEVGSSIKKYTWDLPAQKMGEVGDKFRAVSESFSKKWDEWKKGVFEWFGEVGSSIKKYTWDLPAQKMGEVGDKFRAVSESFSKKWSEWKDNIFGWFGEVGSSIKKYTWDLPGEKLDELFDAFKGITEIFSKKWNEWKDMASKWAGAVKDKISGWWDSGKNALGLGNKKEVLKPETKQESSANTEDRTVNPNGSKDIRSIKDIEDGVINPKGRLEVSTPEGGLFRLNKNDGIVAAPFTDIESKFLSKGGLDSKLTAQTLAKVASNTGDTTTALYNLLRGFDRLANQMNQFANIVANSSNKKSSQIFNMGNNQPNATSTQVVDGLITPTPGFRNMVEGARPVTI